jgi:hypothetical protein
MQSLMVFEGVDSRYTCVKHLDNSQLSKALISKNELGGLSLESLSSLV